MAAMTTVAPVCLRSSAPTARKSVSGRVVAPAALRRSAVSAGRRANGLTVRLRPSPAFRFVASDPSTRRRFPTGAPSRARLARDRARCCFDDIRSYRCRGG